ncbi:hypothetical protein CROQUDRAFT_660498 [Cronartium quercuum f. sp. fusiforme G11]|uniref:Palmitoyltransferase PFA4 n=1 Tax=Cronartium quercuum f. sp. fusiforme G11 TaxID=708437 RepID=A0A9P6T999_9BASI|nr:hypothetical protein CROQUDRAFT_660498 [Cronartium quercuum f. sp. fusiforme G11]
MTSSIVGRIWIAGTLTLISFIAYTSQIFILIPLFTNPWSLKCLQLLVPFNLLVLIVFLNYILCVRTEPGTVPKDWDPTFQIDRAEEDVKKKLLIGSVRFCNACRLYKPPRTHHCRHCHRCVLKMDHHCPWVNNCIGHFNYGHFLRFLISVDLACWYHIWLISKRAFGEYTYGPPPTTTEMLFLITNYVACLPVIIAVGVFSLYHLWSLINNTTSIEIWEKEKAQDLRRKGKINQFTYPFSLGVIRNIQAVLGKNPLFWLVPQRMTGNGLFFPTAPGLDPLEQYLWPPRDLFTRRTQQAQRRRSDWPTKPFTYGDSINPNLIATSSIVFPSGLSEPAHPRRRLVSPYHPHYRNDEEDNGVRFGLSDSDELSDSATIANGHRPDPNRESGEDEDEPLGKLLARRRSQWTADTNTYSSDRTSLPAGPDRFPLPTKARVRRGSEGYEVKPPSWGSPDQSMYERPHEDVEWAYEEGSEGSDG